MGRRTANNKGGPSVSTTKNIPRKSKHHPLPWCINGGSGNNVFPPNVLENLYQDHGWQVMVNIFHSVMRRKGGVGNIDFF